MNKGSDHLHQLIHSMGRQEKRFVSLFVQNNSYGKDSSFQLLLEGINRQQQYDEAALKSWLKGKKAGSLLKHLPVMKIRLYELLLKALRNYTTEDSAEARLHDHIRNIELLYTRALYKQAYNILQKAKKLAGKYEKYWLGGQLLTWEKKLQRATHYKGVTGKQLQALYKAEKETLRQQNNIADHSHLYQQMLLLRIKQGVARKRSDLKAVGELMKRARLRKTEKTDGFELRWLRNELQANYYLMHNDRRNGYKTRKKSMELVAAYPWQAEDEPAEYVRILYNYMFAGRHFPEKRKEIEDGLAQLKELYSRFSSERYRYLRGDMFRNSSIFELDHRTSAGEFQRAAAMQEEVAMGLDKYARELPYRDRLFLCLLTGIACIGAEAFEDALAWNNRVLNDPDVAAMPDLHSFAIMLQLIIHFDLGNARLLEYKVKSVYRFLYRRNRIYQFETVMLRFIRKQLPGIMSRQALKKAFIGLRAELQEVLKDDFERNFMISFDFIAWLDSKIEGRPFAEIVREKAARP